jgi:WD40 repeat protein
MPDTQAPPLDAEQPVAVETPFVGLRPFGWRDADFFFGRDEEIHVISANLQAVPLTLLYGPSGVGKSSILVAGVENEIDKESRRNLGRRRGVEVAAVVFGAWRDDPIAGIAKAVERKIQGLCGRTESLPASGTLSDVLAHWSDVAGGGHLLVILDQFEEYFHYHGEQGEDDFALEFAEAVRRPDLNANFLISIREDAFAKLDCFEDEIPELFETYLRLDHLDPEGARAAIHGPIDEYNRRKPDGHVAIEPELVAAILEQVRPGRLAFAHSGVGDVDEADRDRIAAPFLQLVLERLWNEERHEGSSVLRRSTLERLGETRGIVEAHVRRGLATLSEAEQDIAAQAFRFLATRSGTKIAHTAADLSEFTGIRERTLAHVLDKLVGAETRILNLLPPQRAGGSPSYELYHDLLAEAVLAWRSDRLGAMETRAAKAEARAARRRANRFRSVAAAAILAAAVCLVLLAVALRARHTAIEAKKNARAQELVAESEATLPTDPDGALRKAEQALEEVKPTPQAEFAYRTAVAASQLRVAIRHKYGAMQGATYSGNGSRVIALGTDDTASVSDARTGRLISSIGYDVPLRTADLSRDGKIVVTAGSDDTVRFWNASTGARLATFRNPSLVGAWLDPANPHRAVAAGSDGGLRIWRVGASKPLVLRQRGVRLTEASFSPNGAMVAAIGFSSRTLLFDARTGKLLHTLLGHIRPVHVLAWSPDSHRLVTGGDDARWFVWDVATGSTHLGNYEDGPITAAAFSSDGGYVATASGNHASVWELMHATRVIQLEGHSGLVNDVVFNPGGHLLLTASADGTARIWNIATGTTLTELRGNGGAVSSAVFSPNGKFVLTASDDQAARIWDVDTGRALWTHQGAVTDARFALGGTVVATGGVDQLVVFSKTRTGAAISHLPKDGAVHSIRFSRDGKLLAVGTDDPNLVVRDADTGQPIATLQGNVAAVAGAVFNPKGTEVAVGDVDGSAGIFQARTGRLVRWLHEKGQQRAHPLGRVNGIDWSPDGRYVVTAGSDQQVLVWDGRSGRHLWTFSGHVGSVTSIAFAPHGDQIVTTGLDRTAIVWDVPSHKRLALLQGDPQPLYSASFSPDGRWVATGDSGGVVRVWDVKAQKMLAAIPAHAGPVNAVSFSPDGKQILSASDDWSAKIYSCTTCIPNLDDLRARVIKREKLIAPL